jgi:hypothetical protein
MMPITDNLNLSFAAFQISAVAALARPIQIPVDTMPEDPLRLAS